MIRSRLAACAAMARGIALTIRGEEEGLVMEAQVDAARRYSELTADMLDEAVSDDRSGTPPEISLSRLRGRAAHRRSRLKRP